VLLPGGLIGQAPALKFKFAIAPAFLHPQGITLTHYPTKLLKNQSSTIFEAVKDPECRNLTSPTISTTPLIIPILLTMCGITALWVTRSPKFWPGYHHSNLRYGTTTSKHVGSTRWEIGSYGRKNIGTGLVVSVWEILLVQPCFATEVPGSAKHTLGRREHTQRKEGIANKL